MKIYNAIINGLFVLILLPSCLKDAPLQLPYSGFSPENAEEGLPVSTPGSEGFDAGRLEEIYKNLSDESMYPNIRSLLVVRHGKLVAERYFKDEQDITRLHATMSVTKSITSLIAGIAFDLGYLDSLDAPLINYLPEEMVPEPEKQEVTLHQLLTMETGLNFDNDIHTKELIYCQGSSLSYVLSHPMVFSPGEDWYYGDGNPQLVSGVITRASGKTMEELAAAYLFQPLGISDYFWESHSDGLSLGGMGLWLRPRDMARIGQLMLNRGRWEGTSIVSEDWVNKSTTRQATHRDYGYYWLTSENKTFWASGKGGQLIWVVPEKDLVVVLTSDSYARSWLITPGSYDLIFQGIYEALPE